MSKRKVWFITRPERDPKFHPEALKALQIATNDFSYKWKANRSLHLKYEQELIDIGIKRNNLSNDGSGGRTWAAMLRMFAYVYIDKDGFLCPTKVGKAILTGNRIRENITKQILTFQIPNAYFLESGFRPKYESDFRIRPARFLIRLTNQAELSYYVTKEEITFFALPAKTDDDLAEVTDKIVQFRQASVSTREKIKHSIALEYDHRRRSDYQARDYEMAHGDVAHTFMLICEYTGLVEYIRGEALRINPLQSQNVIETIDQFDQRYPFNTRYLISTQRMAENNGLDINSYKACSFSNIKPATNKFKTDLKIKRLLAKFPNIDNLTLEELTTVLAKEFPEREAIKHAEIIKQDSYEVLNIDFVESYLNETNNMAFEDKTGEIFKAIGFDVIMRPKLDDISTEIEILLQYGDNYCGLIDAKNYKDKFNLTASLVSHMASEYIPNYDGYSGREVSFFGYVTASNWGGARNLKKINTLVRRIFPERNVPGIMLNAATLLGFLDYCIDNELSIDERIELFVRSINNKAYSTIEELLRTVDRNNS